VKVFNEEQFPRAVARVKSSRDIYFKTETMMASLTLLAVFLAAAVCQIVESPIDPADDIINPMNTVRALYCLPPVVWDPALAKLADIWAKQCVYSSSDSGVRDLNYFDILSNLGQNIPNPLTTGENVAAACMWSCVVLL
jgi:uncharacterized protein YkwD